MMNLIDGRVVGCPIVVSRSRAVQISGTKKGDSNDIKLKELGFDGVELDSPGGLDANEAVAASQATGLTIEGVVNSTHWRVRHSDPDSEVRKQAMANMRQAMRYTKSLM
jgi:hexulose-6-phosphate isomerase